MTDLEGARSYCYIQKIYQMYSLMEKQETKVRSHQIWKNAMIEVNIISGRDEYGEIPPKHLPIRVSSDTFTDKEKSVDILDLCKESGEFSPKVLSQVQNQTFNLSKQCIAGSVEECVNQSRSSRSGLDKKCNRNTWFYSPVNCVSKWSKALEQGVSNSMGLERLHTASITAGESEKPDFSFFL